MFLENDFKMDTSLTREQIKAELIGAAGMLYRGAEIVRLQSRKYQGCGTFKSCDHHGIHLDNPDSMERRRNWCGHMIFRHIRLKSFINTVLPSVIMFLGLPFTAKGTMVLLTMSQIVSKNHPSAVLPAGTPIGL